MQPSSQIGTLAEIAQLTGLSKASVSAALSGRGGNTRVSAATVRRVQEAARQLNYRTNASARAMRSKRFSNIGFILVNKETYDYAYSDVILQGITSAATEHEQNVFLLRIPTEPDLSQKLPRPLSEACLDGLIVQDSAQLSPEFVEKVEGCGVPVIYLNEKRSTNAVYIDDVATGRIMTEALLARGFRRIALLAPLSRVPHYSAADRVEGYRNAMEEAGLPSQVKRFPSANWMEDAAAWLASGTAPLPEVIFCSGDQIALSLQRVLYSLDLKIPRDIAIAGCNDEIMAAHSPIPLTTMRIPFPTMSRIAVDLLMQLIEGGQGGSLPSVVLQPELVERFSTGMPFVLSYKF